MATLARIMHSKLETLWFSAEDEDYEYFSDRIEARLHLLQLRSAVLDSETLPVTKVENIAVE